MLLLLLFEKIEIKLHAVVIDMPRGAREKSESGIYHVMVRGANNQEISHDSEDSLRFLEINRQQGYWVFHPT